jgi:Fur family peroxide stress response transcriptional regulator
MNTYTDLLRLHNLKATPQRVEITYALDTYGHLSIENLYEMLRNKFSSISLATIYKNINIMIENAFIQEVKIPHAKSVYELTKATHSHLVCEECKKVEDITLDLQNLSVTASQYSHFQINSANLVFSGICQECQK